MENARPLATVVYLTKNGGLAFLMSLECVRRQIADFPFEILVVDSGSTDGTPEKAEIAGARVVRIPPHEFDYGETKNLAARLAGGELLVYLSQDNIPTSQRWLSTLLSYFKDEVAVVQGPSVSMPDGYYWWARGRFFYTRETRRWLREHGFGLSSCNLALRKETLLRIPFRRVPMSEDKVLQKDLEMGSAVVRAVNDAAVYHTHRYGPQDLALRLQNEGLGWRYAGGCYTLWDMLADIVSPRMWARSMTAAIRGEIDRVHEFLFPLIRPLMIYKGLHFTTEYRWERESA